MMMGQELALLNEDLIKEYDLESHRKLDSITYDGCKILADIYDFTCSLIFHIFYISMFPIPSERRFDYF